MLLTRLVRRMNIMDAVPSYRRLCEGKLILCIQYVIILIRLGKFNSENCTENATDLDCN